MSQIVLEGGAEQLFAGQYRIPTADPDGVHQHQHQPIQHAEIEVGLISLPHLTRLVMEHGPARGQRAAFGRRAEIADAQRCWPFPYKCHCPDFKWSPRCVVNHLAA